MTDTTAIVTTSITVAGALVGLYLKNKWDNKKALPAPEKPRPEPEKLEYREGVYWKEGRPICTACRDSGKGDITMDTRKDCYYCHICQFTKLFDRPDTRVWSDGRLDDDIVRYRDFQGEGR